MTKPIFLHLSSAQFDYLLNPGDVSFSDIWHCEYQSDFDQTLVVFVQYSKCSEI